MNHDDRDPPLDPPLRAALDHTPDRDLRPPAAVRAAVLRAARARLPARPPAWRRWLGLDRGLDSPRLWTAIAGVASVGLALNLAWHVSTTPEASQETARLDGPPAAAPATASTAAELSAAAPVDRAAEAKAVAPSIPDKRERLAEQAPAAAKRAAPRTDKPLAVAAPPGIQATEVTPAAVPSAAPAPAAPAAPPGVESSAAAPIAPASPARGLAADRRLADAAPPPPLAQGALAGSASPPASPWPQPLARFAQALAADGDWPAAGWRITSVGAVNAAPPKAWWQALLQASAGRWQDAAGTPPTDAVYAPAWQVSAPDGSRFTLRLVGGSAWLQAGGTTWRAAPVPPLP